MSVKIAKIDRICPISGDIGYSILDEASSLCGRRQSEGHILRNVSADEAEQRIAKRHKASLVSEEEFEEFLSLFQAEDEERIARNSAIEEQAEKEMFYASLTGVRLKTYNELGLEGIGWRKVASALDDEWRRLYCTGGGIFSGDLNWKNGNGWQPLGG